MKKFKFSLEPVLGERGRIEDEKQRILGERRCELGAAEDELARLHEEFKRHSTVLRDEHKTLDSEQLRWHYAHLEYLDRCITTQYGVVTQRRIKAERARVALVEASKDRKVIEKLKDKRFKEHRSLRALIEQKELDDTNNRRPTHPW